MTSMDMTMRTMHLSGLGVTCPTCQAEMELERAARSEKPSLLNFFRTDVYRCPRCGRRVPAGGALFCNA